LLWFLSYVRGGSKTLLRADRFDVKTVAASVENNKDNP
jgi:hypothetical protein